MNASKHRDLVLAIQPFRRGLAFVLFEGPLSPVDWGVKEIRGKRKNARSFDAAKRLIAGLRPDVLVFEECAGPYGRRPARVRRLQKLIASYAVAQSIDVHSFTRQGIRECFKAVGATTRYEIAQAIAGQVAALGHRMPPLRKLWMSEDVRMNLFDAASIVWTYYRRAGIEPSDVDEA